MRLRSMLFVPGDRPERMEKALSCGADALILDLEDSVTTTNKDAARSAVVSFFAQAVTDMLLFVRVNSLDSTELEADLNALAGQKLAGIMLPKAEGASSIIDLVNRLATTGLGGVRVLPIATETPSAIFQLGTYASISTHLCGLTWGAEDLPAAIGAITAREADGGYTPPYQLVRSLALFAAHAASVAAIETVYPAIADLDGLTAYAARARRDGFTGMMAIHPKQVRVINAAFSPDEADVAHARAVVAAFAANPGSGALQLHGKMIDAPHLKQALRLIAGIISK